MNEEDWDDVRLGLGYGTSNDHQADKSGIAFDAAAVANAYLQQCIQYHELVSKRDAFSHPIEFVAAKSVPQENNEPESSNVIGSISNESITSVPASSELDVQCNREVEEGRERARAILKRLQEQTEVTIPDHGAASSSEYFVSDSPFRRQRDIGFQREAKRKRSALLANLEYIARKEGERARALETKIDEARDLEILAQERYDQMLRVRQQNRNVAQLNSTAGIGTLRRKKTEEKKRMKRVARNAYETLALYVSGLPTDESIIDEESLMKLFECYGTVQKIHFYRDKTSGALKGDGLIIYKVDSGSDGSILSQSVCSQMNGAELPSGQTIAVQPANTNKEQVSDARKGNEPSSQQLNAEQELEINEPDLDDFFSSL